MKRETKQISDITIMFHEKTDIETPDNIVDMLAELATKYNLQEVIVKDVSQGVSQATFIDKNADTTIDVNFKKGPHTYRSLFALNIEIEEKLEMSLA